MKLIKAYTAAGQLEAEIIKAFLESQGIEVILNQESIGKTYGLSAGTLGQVDVLVSETQEDEVKVLLTDLAAGKYESLGDQDISELDNNVSYNEEDQ